MAVHYAIDRTVTVMSDRDIFRMYRKVFRFCDMEFVFCGEKEWEHEDTGQCLPVG